ncbi:hypothetical protein OAG36_00645 [bacterium]|nr:hypothetical protein [bacterium]
MADEAQIRTSLQIVNTTTKLEYRSAPTAFTGDVTASKGPVPGAFSATLDGVDADFSELTTPAYCRMMNLDATNFVTYGIWDDVTFYPLGEILPGESYVIRISRDLTEEFGTGTGTTGTAINTLRFKADTAAVNVLVEAFET